MPRHHGAGWRFLVAGAVNTLFGWLIYSASVLLGAPVWMALIVSTVVGIGFNFLTIGGYAFRALSTRRLPKFVSAYALVYVANLSAIEALEGWIFDPIWVQLLLTPPMALLSFMLMSRWVFANGIRGVGDQPGKT